MREIEVLERNAAELNEARVQVLTYLEKVAETSLLSVNDALDMLHPAIKRYESAALLNDAECFSGLLKRYYQAESKTIAREKQLVREMFMAIMSQNVRGFNLACEIYTRLLNR